MSLKNLERSAKYAASSPDRWQAFFERLREDLPVDRICAALRLDQYTAYLPLVAQIQDLEPYLGGAGLYADREHSRTLDVIAEGQPFLAQPGDWKSFPDLAFYSLAVNSNVKFPISLGGHPTVLNLWSRTENAFSENDVARLEPVADALSQSPFQLQLEPVGLALRKAKDLMASREGLQKAVNRAEFAGGSSRRRISERLTN